MQGLLKQVVKRLIFPDNSVRPILFGPLRGFRWRVNSITGLSPIYSGQERLNQLLFQRYIEPGDTVFDIGANWGIHTLLFQRLVGEAGKVFSFEPYMPVYDELRFHARLNSCRSVECLSYGLTNYTGQAIFSVASNPAMGGLAKHRFELGNFTKDVAISVTTVDAFCAERRLKRLDFIKLDVEGAEPSVLEGAEETIKRFWPTILVDRSAEDRDEKCWDFLTSLGYQPNQYRPRHGDAIKSVLYCKRQIG